MITRVLLGLTLLIFVLPACAQQPTPEPTPTVDPLVADTSPKPVEMQTRDNVTIKGTYYPPPNPQTRSPAILLVHMLDNTKESWQDFAIAAQDAGYAVLAIDLRGHGESDGSQTFEKMDNDLDTALFWLIARPETDGERIGIAGASIGANLAIRGGSRYPQVKSVVMLSPALDYRGLTSAEALSNYGQRATMIVATEKDTLSADPARTLNSRALGQHQLQIYPGSDHGTNIFKAQAGLKPMMLAWFKSTL